MPRTKNDLRKTKVIGARRLRRKAHCAKCKFSLKTKLEDHLRRSERCLRATDIVVVPTYDPRRGKAKPETRDYRGLSLAHKKAGVRFQFIRTGDTGYVNGLWKAYLLDMRLISRHSAKSLFRSNAADLSRVKARQLRRGCQREGTLAAMRIAMRYAYRLKDRKPIS